MSRYKPKPPTPVPCHECGGLIDRKPGSGRIPKYCPTCKLVARARQQRAWHTNNPERSKELLVIRQLKYRYGLTVEEAQTLRENGCAVCGSRQRLCIDHCHTSGSVRAALCTPCNTALGMAKDNPGKLRALADYLDRHAADPTSVGLAA